MNLKMPLLRGIYSSGFEKPSLIQQKALVPMITGKDIIAESQSGTGKTAMFVISVLQRIVESDIDNVQALILSPTRELAQQIGEVIANIGEYMNVKSQTFIGGTSLKADITNLSKGVHIVVGTPGRILELIKKKILSLNSLKTFILDEADEMLSRGFLKMVTEIQKHLPKGIQTAVFSATLQSKEVLSIVRSMTVDPAMISLNIPEDSSVEEVKQFYIKIEDKGDKLETLMKLYQKLEISQTFIYCNSKSSVEILTEELAKRGFSVTSIHSDYSQTEREKQLKDFKLGSKRILVTSDLLARGIDISQIDLVLNYEIPVNPETYVHRIGRTGRFGKKGTAISFVDTQKDEMKSLQTIESRFKLKIEEFQFETNISMNILINYPELTYPKKSVPKTTPQC